MEGLRGQSFQLRETWRGDLLKYEKRQWSGKVTQLVLYLLRYCNQLMFLLCLPELDQYEPNCCSRRNKVTNKPSTRVDRELEDFFTNWFID
jgi:hypothetical protein